jgi:outer membrane protein assembly factor BamA
MQLELLEQLQTMPIQRVSVPNSTVLPAEVVRVAVKRSGLIGHPLRTDRVQDFARHLKKWYLRQGFVLHSVTGATLKPETATAEITVEEPRVSRLPVEIVFCKEMVIDDETGELMTFRQYREKKVKEVEGSRSNFRRGLVSGLTLDKQLDRKNLNTTFVQAKGRTKPSKVAKALRLVPGRPFQWYPDRWKKVAGSGIFSTILRASPERASDGSVCLQVYAIEPPARHLEYGIGKSLYTDSWEGEVDLDWRNVFGGGESIGVMVRRGTKDASPSVRFRYGDDRFGLEGGYDVEVFSDFLGDTPNDDEDNKDTTIVLSSFESKETDSMHDALLNRRGATFRLRNPVNPSIVRHSVASASLERTSTTTGRQESIGSATITLGPFRKLLPMDARSSISTTITGGTRLLGVKPSGGDVDGSSKEKVSFYGLGADQFLPFTSGSAKTVQILPVFVSEQGKETTLALQHTISSSTPNLPRHEAKAMGNAAQIRGAAPDGPASSTLKGTAELRIPIVVPSLGDGKVVLFGDWFFAQKDLSSPFYSKSSIGIGIRKSLQGLPLKCDFCYSSEGKMKTMFGLGPDFDV